MAKVTPFWPQANSEVERFNRTIGKAIRTAHTEGKDWRTEIHTFLLNYRARPHSTTGVSPAKLMYRRNRRTKINALRESVKSSALQQAIPRDSKVKENAKDKRLKAVPCDIKAGDWVLLKQWNHQNKLTTNVDPKPFVIVERRGPSVILRQGSEKTAIRNIKFVRMLPPNAVVNNHLGQNDSDDDNELPTTGPPPEQVQPNQQERPA